MATRAERKERVRKIRQEQAGNSAERYEADRRRREREERASVAEELGIGLQYPSIDPETGKPSTDLDGELRGAVLWARLLGIRDPVSEGTTLADLLRRIFYEFTSDKHRSRMWNPYAERFSEDWVFTSKQQAFNAAWSVIEGSSELLLDPSDFEGSSGAAMEIPKDTPTVLTEKTAPLSLLGRRSFIE